VSGHQPRRVGFALSRPAARVFRPLGRRDVLQPPSPAFADGFILPRALPSSSERRALAVCPPSRPAAFRPPAVRERLPWGFVSLFAVSPAASTITRRSHSTLCSVLGVPPALDGLRHHWIRGFVAPRNHVQGSPFRGLSLSWSRAGFHRPPALVSIRAVPPAVSRASRPARRLQGLAPHVSAVTNLNGEIPVRSAPLLGFPPPGPRSRTVATPSRRFRLRPSLRRARRNWSLASCRCER